MLELAECDRASISLPIEEEPSTCGNLIGRESRLASLRPARVDRTATALVEILDPVSCGGVPKPNLVRRTRNISGLVWRCATSIKASEVRNAKCCWPRIPQERILSLGAFCRDSSRKRFNCARKYQRSSSTLTIEEYRLSSRNCNRVINKSSLTSPCPTSVHRAAPALVEILDPVAGGRIPKPNLVRCAGNIG